MITVSIQRDQEGRITTFTVSGHADYGEHGQDIVCAGVSAIVQTAILGLQEYLRIDCAGSQKSGLIVCELPFIGPELRRSVDAILETMLLGLTAIASAYAGYVQIHDSKEV